MVALKDTTMAAWTAVRWELPKAVQMVGTMVDMKEGTTAGWRAA